MTTGFTLHRTMAALPLLILLNLFVVTAYAEPSALVVVGLCQEDNASELRELANSAREHFIKRGFPSNRVEVLSGKVSRELILQRFADAATKATTNDEFALVLFGVTGKAKDGGPAFQVGGPRLTAGDLKTALDAIPARQFVFIGTGNGGGFLPLLQDGRRTVLSATRADSQPDSPRFNNAWVEELGVTPKAPFAEVAARASARVAAQYTKLNLAQTEHAQLADPATGNILDAPFGVTQGTTNGAASR